MTLSDWVMIIKDCFNCKKSKYAIGKEIKTTCLDCDNKISGVYKVNNDLVWRNILVKDNDCLFAMKQRKIKDIIGLLSWFEEYQYQCMRATYGRAHTRKR